MPATPPPPRIDPAARRRWLARMAAAEQAPWLHQEVARRMAERLSLMRQPPSSWLDWWAHAGGGAAAVRAVWPEARRIAVEPSQALLARSQAAQRAPWWALHRRAQAGQGVLAADAVPDGAAGMLWANMMLHVEPDPLPLLQRWNRALAADGFVMFSTLGPDTLRRLRACYADLGWPEPAPPFTDMHDLGDLLVQAGFADPVMDQEQLTLTWSGPEALLSELHGLGGNLSFRRHPGLRTPRWRQRLLAALESLRQPDGRLSLGFELVYGHAFKGQPRPAAGEPAVISLQQLRVNRPKP